MIKNLIENRRLVFAPEHGGSNVKGGGRQSVPAEGESEEVLTAMEAPKPGEPRVHGTPDPGIPGSRTNPTGEEESESPSGKPVTPPRMDGTGAGS